MGLARSDRRSPVSPLYPHNLSFSSSGGDQEDDKARATLNADPCAEIMNVAVHAQKKLKMAMERASQVQQGLATCHVQTQGVLERIPALEAFMVSLASKATASKDLQTRINTAMQASVSLLITFAKLHTYETHLLEGPKGDVGRYIQCMSTLQQLAGAVEKKCPPAIESLVEMVQFLQTSKMTGIDNFRLYKLNETATALKTLQARQQKVNPHDDLLNEGCEQLETEFRRILTDYGLSHIFLGVGMLDPSYILPALLPSPVVQLLEVVAANLTANGRLKNCLEIYEDVRSCKVYDNFCSLDPAYLPHMKPEALDSLQWPILEEYIALWSHHMYVMVEVLLKSERVLFDSIFVGTSMSSLDCSACFGSLAMKSGLGMILNFGEAFAKSEKEPQKIFKLLDMFETVDSLYGSLEEVLHGVGCIDARDRIQDLQKMIVHGACAVFWEFGLQVEVQREGSPPEDGGVLKLVSYVINYLKYLMSDMYRHSMAEVLRIEQYWRGSAVEEVELPTVILHIMQALHRNVESRALAIEEPALSCVFRMNNYWYIYTRCKSSNLGMLLGEDWLNEQREGVEHIAVQYEREAWSGVVSHLSMEGLRASLNTNRTQELVQARIKAFQEALADMRLKHSKWWFPSPDLRQQIGTVVLEFIVPAYRSYIFNCSQLVQQDDFMKTQITAEEVEHMLSTLFEEKAVARRMSGHAVHVNGHVNYESS